MPAISVFSFTILALMAFAGNSVLCRLALSDHSIDANSFTLIRLFSGALTLIVLLLLQSPVNTKRIFQSPNLKQASALFIYAACFSYAYIQLDTASGALLLFASVQFTMLAVQFIRHKAPSMQELSGLMLAMMGFVYWMLPNSQPPSYLGSVLMIISGMAWAAYTLFGQSSKQAQFQTAQNFLFSLPFLVLLIPGYFFIEPLHITQQGLILAIASGSMTSAIGYWLWYAVLPKLSISSAAVLQLSVPVLAAIGGFIWNQEMVSQPFIMACSFILLGIYLVLAQQVSSKKHLKRI